ncbi:TVG0750122 [Thermoplasma volcanium GSS1]|uniref:TVG0750122 protein n=1 Tax=Thermoplasma volcanium (strain ATCC 51530 / DSM 4299 / JCM 9571 / NBRC 15438 / GSS1) TaxID=273116 RepID=Q97AR5_THEVO|nr:hypothetical protein [Thermoplasma volcanium]BAB59886.1 TVG0750122 [Thermoplasma volcanium GSS1]
MFTLFAIQFFTTAAAVAFLLTELMGGFMLLFDWKNSGQKIMTYVAPIWEVTGTFLAMFVVETDATFAGILIPAAFAFAALLLIFLILFIVRNVAIILGEFAGSRKIFTDRQLYYIYVIATLLISVVFLAFSSAIISGNGVKIDIAGNPVDSLLSVSNAEISFNLASWLAGPGDILFVVSAALIAFGLSPVFYDVDRFSTYGVISSVIGFILGIVSFVQMGVHISPIIIIPAIIIIGVPILYRIGLAKKILTNKALFIVLLIVSIYSLYFTVYPSAMNGKLPLSQIITTGPMVIGTILTTVVGFTLLAFMLSLYVYVNYRSSRNQMTTLPK